MLLAFIANRPLPFDMTDDILYVIQRNSHISKPTAAYSLTSEVVFNLQISKKPKFTDLKKSTENGYCIEL